MDRMSTTADRERIIAYLRRERAAGYDIATIRNYLLNQGYNEELVDTSIDQLFGKKKRIIEIPTSFSFLQNKAVMIVLLVILLIGIGTVVYLFIGEDESSKVSLPKVQAPRAPLTPEEEPSHTQEETATNTAPADNIPLEETKGEIFEKRDNAKITQYTLETKIAQFATLEEAINFCDEKEVVKDDCLAEVASKFEQPQLCTMIATVGKKENCILELAWSERGYEFCGEINDARKQNLCRNIAGMRSRDLTNNLNVE